MNIFDIPDSLLEEIDRVINKNPIFRTIDKSQIHWMKTDDVLKMAAQIPTHIDQDEYESIWKDMNENGMKTPLEVTVSKSNARLDSGNHRIQLFKKNGINHVPVRIRNVSDVIKSPLNGTHLGIPIEDFNKFDPRK